MNFKNGHNLMICGLKQSVIYLKHSFILFALVIHFYCITLNTIFAGSIDSKSLDKLIQRFEKLKVCDKRACKGRTTTNQKRTSNNTGQLVLRNPFGPIIAHKGKDKPRKKLPKVDIDMESMRVFNLLIENGGEIDEDLDKEKEMWWEEQRKIFEGRAASFIARMRLVLGTPQTFLSYK